MLLLYGTFRSNKSVKAEPRDWFRNLIGLDQVPPGCKFAAEIVPDTILEISTNSKEDNWFNIGRYKVIDLLTVNSRSRVDAIVKDWSLMLDHPLAKNKRA